MKHVLIRFLLPVLLFVSFSCKKDDAEPVSLLPTAPEAQSIHDAKSGGVYKGVIVGSSGVIKVILQKGVVEIHMTLDNVSKTLTTTDLDGWTSGEIIRNARFTADDWEILFSVGAEGTGSGANLNIPGHPDAEVIMLKETSKKIVRAFEGTYAGTESGNWNFIIQDAVLAGISRSADGLTMLAFSGLVNESSITLDTLEGTGTISGDNVTGTWTGSVSGSGGTWTGKRIL